MNLNDKKYISFSLGGNDPKYLIGSVRNLNIINKLLPGGKCVFYVASNVESIVVNKLKRDGAIIVQKDGNQENKNGLPSFWRFEAVSTYKNSIVIVRDADSRITKREISAINEGLASDKTFHIIRDHPNHTKKIMAGMGGIKGDIINFSELMKNFLLETKSSDYCLYDGDQIFLEKIIYPLIKTDVLIHDEFYGGQKIKTERVSFEYIGEPFNAKDGIDNIEYTNIIKKHLMSNK